MAKITVIMVNSATWFTQQSGFENWFYDPSVKGNFCQGSYSLSEKFRDHELSKTLYRGIFYLENFLFKQTPCYKNYIREIR